MSSVGSNKKSEASDTGASWSILSGSLQNATTTQHQLRRLETELSTFSTLRSTHAAGVTMEEDAASTKQRELTQARAEETADSEGPNNAVRISPLSKLSQIAGQFVNFVATGHALLDDPDSDPDSPRRQHDTNIPSLPEAMEGVTMNHSLMMPTNTNSVTGSLTTRSTIQYQESTQIPPDDPKHMTLGRRIARKLQQYKWYYNPQAVQLQQQTMCNTMPGMQPPPATTDIPSNPLPDLDAAWTYFEHVTLPRYVIPSIRSAGTQVLKSSAAKPKSFRGKLHKYICGSEAHQTLNRAEPGEAEKPTRLYPVWHAPLSQMGDFGIGVGLYFTTLLALSFITFVAGLITIPNLIYYSSTAYSVNGQPTRGPPDASVKIPTLGSAICTDQSWVVCQDCTFSQFRGAESRVAVYNETCRLSLEKVQQNTSNTCTMFAKKNNCLGAQMEQGMVNYAALMFIFVAMLVMNRYQRRKAIEFDEDEQTAQDYSIVVNNPPEDAYDPQEWKEYFSAFEDATVTVCTVVVANDVLLQALAELREKKRQLELLLPVGQRLDINLVARMAAEIRANASGMHCIKSIFQPFGLFLDIPALYDRIIVLEAQVRGLALRNYPASKVFVTFETEDDQRNVLSQLSYGKVRAFRQNVNAVPKEYLFRGTHVLSVDEPAEPSAIRWHNLDDTLKSQVTSLSITTLVCICAIVLVAFIVKLCRDKSAIFAAIAISVFNALFPAFAQAMTNIESHTDEGYKQRSLYIKIALFRWVNTAIVVQIITPFATTISAGADSLINQIYAVMFAEIVTVNVLQYADIGGQIQRHFLAPRAPDQARMNLCFRGTPYDLAERYTTVTKILFYNFYYSSIFPGTFFFSSVAFFLNYCFDKFSIMRTWAAAPTLGPQVPEFSRKYFLNGCIVALAVVTAYTLSGFPYDSLCDTGEQTAAGGSYTAYTYSQNDVPELVTVPIQAGDAVYKYCSQNMYRRLGGKVAFPPLPMFQPKGSEWMTAEQEHVMKIYGWTTVGFIGFFALVFVWRIYKLVFSFFYGGYKPHGRDMNINFSDVDVIDSYVPQVKSDLYGYPLIACNIDNIDESLMSWKDPSNPYDYYNLTKDAEEIFQGTDYAVSAHAFSKIKHWQPEDDSLHGQ